MRRRTFLAIAASFLAAPVFGANRKKKKFRFKVRTKSGGIVGNILIQGWDIFDAQQRVLHRYPGATILEGKEV